jgi:hypothetical protein
MGVCVLKADCVVLRYFTGLEGSVFHGGSLQVLWIRPICRDKDGMRPARLLSTYPMRAKDKRAGSSSEPGRVEVTKPAL